MLLAHHKKHSKGLFLALFLSIILLSGYRLGAQEIAVVVHIVSTKPDSITDLMVQEGIDDLNDAFAHRNTYASQGPGYNTGLSFCLAKKDPNGGNTKGITRTNSVFGDYDRDIENYRMKNLVSWDTKRYCNIWLVDGIKTEIFPMFVCGKWLRATENGYATHTKGGDFWDGVVVTSFGPVLAHNLGHYLGLKHTFTINECANNNCAIDGDGICDTPPSTVSTPGCGASINTCSSDTINGQGPDLQDLTGNFMTYGVCTFMFTKGQADVMKSELNSTRKTLLWNNRCDSACKAEPVIAGFTRSNWYPTPGDLVQFTNTFSQGTTYQWTVNGAVVGSSPNLSYAFPDTGKYGVTLKVWNNDPACFGSQTDSIIVNCGVISRFFPDKRIIASKHPILLDSVIFKNRSRPDNASFQWFMSNNGTMMLPAVISTDKDLNYTFMDSGSYRIRLVSNVGACYDTTESFDLRVEDPTVDGVPNIHEVVCFNDDKVRLTFQICNNGYSTIPAGVPISFYDSDPRLLGAKKIGNTFPMPDALTGKCCGTVYTVFLDPGRKYLDTIFVAFNDNGNVLPISFPDPPDTNLHATIPELKFSNNIASRTGFGFRTTASPPTADMVPGDELPLVGIPGAGANGFRWLSSPSLSCTNCQTPTYKARFTDEAVLFISENATGCRDTARVVINVPPWNDYTVKLDSLDCYTPDSLVVDFTLCDLYAAGYIPKGIKVAFFDADPKLGNAKLLGPVFTTVDSTLTKCGSYRYVIPSVTNGKIFAVVNHDGTLPFVMPADSIFLEKNYLNNYDSISALPEVVTLTPSDTTVLRKQLVTVRIASQVYDPSSVIWYTSSGLRISCLTGCPSTLAQVMRSDTLKMTMKNRYACTIGGFSVLKVFPPDYRIDILETHCYTNEKTLVKFTLCMGNGYDSIPKAIPVSFYDGDPKSGTPVLLQTAFFTPGRTQKDCETFTHIIQSPLRGMVTAIVNQRPSVTIPDMVFPETDTDNNADSAKAERFTVTITPGDTSIYRTGSISFAASSTGGTVSFYSWKPAGWLSCSDCPSPIARIPYSQTFTLFARNQYECTSGDTTNVRTYTEGRYFLPNAFTPNNDGLNDMFYVMGSKDIAVIRDFSVYDRYGQRVFHATDIPANDPVFGWNGTRNGKDVSSATFAYSIMIEYIDKTSDFVKGLVTVIR